MTGLWLLTMMAPLPWGKKPCKIWKDEIVRRQEAGPKLQGDGRWLAHPVANLRWFNVEVASNHFDVANSATLCFAALNNYESSFALAEKASTTEECMTVQVVKKDHQLFLADEESLQRAIASALLDREVYCAIVDDFVAGGIQLDRNKYYAIDRRRRGRATHGSESRPPSDLPTMLDPRIVANSRDLETCVWPKCLHFARVLKHLDHGPEAFAARFGQVPVRRLGSHWTVGSRHRPMAALLTGRSFHCRLVRSS